MKKIGLLALLILVALIASYEGLNLGKTEEPPPLPQQSLEFHRLISLAPSITETLFALGLGEQVVGVTRYCDYPPEALTKPQVGGYLDPNLEAIIALKPDLVITFAGHQALETRLEQLGISTLQVGHQKLSDILDSIRVIGKMTGKNAEAKTLLAKLRAQMEAIEAKTTYLSRPQVLVVMSRPFFTPIKEVFIAGKGDPYNEMIRIAGGINAYQGGLIRVPPLSAEGIIHLNPEVIIELVSDRRIQEDGDEKALLEDWASLSEVAAVKTNRVHLFADDFDTVPGPRFILTLEKMAQVIHPEVDWSTL